jgi:hypothetical protein
MKKLKDFFNLFKIFIIIMEKMKDYEAVNLVYISLYYIENIEFRALFYLFKLRRQKNYFFINL